MSDPRVAVIAEAYHKEMGELIEDRALVALVKALAAADEAVRTRPPALDLTRIEHTAELGMKVCEDRSPEMLRLLGEDVPALVAALRELAGSAQGESAPSTAQVVATGDDPYPTGAPEPFAGESADK